MSTQPSSPDMRWLAALPYHASLDLPVDDTAPREARRLIAKLLPDWSLPQFEIVTSLIASELVTNALAATRQMPQATQAAGALPLRLWLCGGPCVTAVLTWDPTPNPPIPRTAGETDESGRGLAIIGMLSAGSGFYYPENRHPEYPAGKVTWAIITTPLFPAERTLHARQPLCLRLHRAAGRDPHRPPAGDIHPR